MTRSVHSLICTCLLFCSVLYSGAFVTHPNHRRYPIIFTREEGVLPSPLFGFNLFGTNDEKDIDCIDTVTGKLRSYIRDKSEQAVSDAKGITRKAIDDMETLAYRNADAAVNSVNSSYLMVPEKMLLEQMSKIKAKALQEIDVILEQLDKDAAFVAEKFKMLMAVVY